jgi:steroid 5-alpha reductase family enzyme
MRDKLYTKTGSLILVVFVYSAAFIIAAIVFQLFKGTGVLVATLLADVAATLVVWGTGLIFKNASLYDPYWSVIPMFVIPFWVIIKGFPAAAMDILVIIAVTIWGIRLTMNWVLGWKGLTHQDWRYTMLKEKNPDIWFITNLGGINMMPTIFVFLGMVPAYYMINNPQKPNTISIIGFLICLAAASLQFFSDRQMSLFRKEAANSGKCINNGLWKFSRHPNYLGEISLWWGIWVMQIGVAPQHWLTVIGPVAMTILFVFISIPMMEKYVMAKRPGYAEYKKTVPMLIPFPKKRP